MKNSTKTWISTGLTLTVIAAAIWLFSGWHGGMGYGYGHGYGYMPYGMMVGGGGMGVVMILFWVIVVVALALVVSGILGGQNENRSNTTCAPDAMEILKQRYARGDIEREEYELKKRELNE